MCSQPTHHTLRILIRYRVSSKYSSLRCKAQKWMRHFWIFSKQKIEKRGSVTIDRNRWNVKSRGLSIFSQFDSNKNKHKKLFLDIWEATGAYLELFQSDNQVLVAVTELYKWHDCPFLLLLLTVLSREFWPDFTTKQWKINMKWNICSAPDILQSIQPLLLLLINTAFTLSV